MSLRDARKFTGKSLRQVARETGISQGQLSYWENGKTAPSIKSLMRLANHYGVTIDSLIDRHPPKPSTPDQAA